MTLESEPTMPQSGGTASDQSRPAQVADRAGHEASNLAGTATEGVREVADEAMEQAKAVAGQARDQIQGLIDQARSELGEQVQQRNEQAAGQLRTLSEQLAALASGRPENAGPLAGYLSEAEGQVRRLASRLEQRGPQGVVDDVTSFARRRSGLFLLGAVGLGFMIGRAVRAGSAAQQSSSTTSQWNAPSRQPTMASLPNERALPTGNGPTGVTTGMPR